MHIPEPDKLALCPKNRRWRRRHVLGLLAGGLSALPFGKALAAADGPGTPAPLEVQEIADGVFVHKGEISLMIANNQGLISNTGFIVGRDCVAVVDTGGSVFGGNRLLDAIRARTDKPVRYVFNTHMHPDHIFGNAAFEGAGTDFVGHRNLARALEARFTFFVATNRPLLGERLMAGLKLVPPTIPVSDSMHFDLGARRLTATAHPAAHTDCDLTLLDEATGTLFAGDLVFVDQTPSIDGSIKGWVKVLDVMAEWPVRRAVPGHGPRSINWPEGALPLRRYLETVISDCRKAIAAGTPMEQAVDNIGLSEKSRWKLFSEFNTRNATAAFAELEWE